MPTHRRAGAGRIEQDAVKGLPSHHCPRVAGTRVGSTRRPARPSRERFRQSRWQLGVDIERGQLINRPAQADALFCRRARRRRRVPACHPSRRAAAPPAGRRRPAPRTSRRGKPGSRSTGRGRLSTSMLSTAPRHPSCVQQTLPAVASTVARRRLTRSVSGPWPLPPQDGLPPVWLFNTNSLNPPRGVVPRAPRRAQQP